MKNLLTFIITFLIFNNSFAQKSESELLKNYEFYVEKNIEMEKWSTKYYLKNGLVSVQENYWKNELRSRKEFEYDRFGNLLLQRETGQAGISDDRIKGFVLGICAHGVGTARAFETSGKCGAFSSLGLGLTGAITAMILPWVIIYLLK